jgi:outer membrane protein assembly factor BamB
MGNQMVKLDSLEPIFQEVKLTKSPYDCYDVSEIPMGYDDIPPAVNIVKETVQSSIISNPQPPKELDLMNSSWPMYCHDPKHSGQSPFHTINTWDKIWRYDTIDLANGDVVIGSNGTIYIGSTGLYAIYNNGSLKWKYNTYYHNDGAPALDENGTIYFGTVYGSPSYLYALNANGSLKWKYSVGGTYNIFSSPVIGSDNTIYFGCGGGHPPSGKIIALNPDGSLLWFFNTSHMVYSSPAIGHDGTIYCGSHDTYLYALYPNNGTMKWQYKTGDWIRTSPCIDDAGIIYTVSLDNNLYAIYPNGTLRWKNNLGEAGTTPTIGNDGSIYCGYSNLYAISPDDGNIKWSYDVDGTIRGGTPCNSIDGEIIFGTSDGGEIIVLNNDGSEKWRKKIGTCESAPAIDHQGRIYIGSGSGYLYAFGMANLTAYTHGPYYGLTQTPVNFQGSVSGGIWPHSFLWDFGDGNTSTDQNPMHTYSQPGNYSVSLTVTDNTSNMSSDTTWTWVQDGNQPPDIPVIDGRVKGKSGETYEYSFQSIDPEGRNIWYYVDWGDGSNSGWNGPHASGSLLEMSHKWYERTTYTIRVKARDVYGDESDWGMLEIQIPYYYQYPGWQWLCERFPLLTRLFTTLKNI